MGDLKNGRMVHSLAWLLGMYDVQRINFVAPERLQIVPQVLEELASRGVEQREFASLGNDVVSDTNVLYVTRVQEERFASADEYELVKGGYRITPRSVTRAKENMIIMHPLSRVGEISRAVYFRQMHVSAHGVAGHGAGAQLSGGDVTA